MKKTAFVIVILVAVISFAQNRITSDQGKPGTQGPWPVTLSGGGTIVVGGADGGVISTAPVLCRGTTADAGNPSTITTVAGVATAVPAGGNATNRVYINVCNSAQNVSTAVVKCETGGAAVSIYGGAGDVLLFGDCVLYSADQNNQINCSADGGYSVTAFECVPQ